MLLIGVALFLTSLLATAGLGACVLWLNGFTLGVQVGLARSSVGRAPMFWLVDTESTYIVRGATRSFRLEVAGGDSKLFPIGDTQGARIGPFLVADPWARHSGRIGLSPTMSDGSHRLRWDDDAAYLWLDAAAPYWGARVGTESWTIPIP